MLFDRVKVSTVTTGTGSVTPGNTAPGGFLSFAVVPAGSTVTYALEDAGNAEWGTGVYSGGVLTRVMTGSTTGSLLNLSGSATLFLTAISADLNRGLPPYRSGYWYTSDVPSTIGNAANTSLNTSLWFIPVFLREAVTIDAIVARVITLASGGNFQLGIYANDPLTMSPTGTPLSSYTGLSTSQATQIAVVLTTPLTFQPGIMWVALEADNASVRFQVTVPTDMGFARARGTPNVGSIAGQAGGNNAVNGLFVTNTYGTFPNVTGVTFNEATGGAAPVMLYGFRKA